MTNTENSPEFEEDNPHDSNKEKGGNTNPHDESTTDSASNPDSSVGQEPESFEPDDIDHDPDEESVIEFKSIDEEAKEKLTKTEQKILSVIGKEIRENGMSVKEACQLVNLEYEQFEALLEAKPVAKKIIEHQELRYRREIKKTVMGAIQHGDDDKAYELLQKIDPQKFGDEPETDEHERDILKEAIEFCQENSDKIMLISRKDSRPDGKDGEEVEGPDTSYQEAIEAALS